MLVDQSHRPSNGNTNDLSFREEKQRKSKPRSNKHVNLSGTTPLMNRSPLPEQSEDETSGDELDDTPDPANPLGDSVTVNLLSTGESAKEPLEKRVSISNLPPEEIEESRKEVTPSPCATRNGSVSEGVPRRDSGENCDDGLCSF